MQNQDKNENKISFDDKSQINAVLASEDGTHVYKPNENNGTKKYRISDIYEWLDVIVSSVIAVVIIFTLIFRIAVIDGNSMLNTLHNGERVIISNMFYEPKYGDIVVISRNTDNSASQSDYQKPIIKRVIATAGQTVDIDFAKGTVSVDGNVLNENYIKEPTTRQLDIQFPVRVPENCIFVMGDNRNDSLDSRSTLIGENGMINTKYILGHALFRIYPFNKVGGLK